MPKASKAIGKVTSSQLKKRVHATNAAKLFGFVIVKAQPGRVAVRMRVEERHKQVHGVVHGGVVAALADTAGGLASYMAYPRGTRVATIEMKINFLEAVEGGDITAEAVVVRKGMHIAVTDCDVRDSSRRLLAKALMTFFVGPFRKNRKKRSA